jgi:hypothetical protein
MIPPRLGEPKKPAKNWRQFPRAVGTACKNGGKSGMVQTRVTLPLAKIL